MIRITGIIKSEFSGGYNGDVTLTLELSLRDLFAAAALAGIVASSHRSHRDDVTSELEKAYKYADA